MTLSMIILILTSLGAFAFLTGLGGFLGGMAGNTGVGMCFGGFVGLIVAGIVWFFVWAAGSVQ